MSQPPDDGLTERQREAVPVVLAAATLKAGLDAAEVHRSTWYRWLQEPVFRRHVEDLRQQAFGEAMADLRGGARFAVTSLLGLLASKSESIRLQASRSVLELAQRGFEADELAQRLERIEAAITSVSHPGAPS